MFTISESRVTAGFDPPPDLPPARGEEWAAGLALASRPLGAEGGVRGLIRHPVSKGQLNPREQREK